MSSAPVRQSTAESYKTIIDTYLATLPRRDANDTSPIILGEGAFRYQLLNDWARIPAGWRFSDVPGIAVDANDRVYVFNRGEHPVMIFDRDGTFLRAWGEGVFTRPHGIFIGPDGMVYLADDGDHSVRKCTPEGTVVLTLGTPGKPAPYMSGDPFCRCTDVALSPQGEIYVSDGYYNARVHKYAPDGRLLLSWGGPGTRPGEFNVAHNIICDAEGWVYVADRENHRIQVFDANGKFETQWNNMHRANSLDQDKSPQKLIYLGESPPEANGVNAHMPNCGPGVIIMTPKGERLAKLGSLTSGLAPDRFLTCHGLAVDSHADIYVGDNTDLHWRGRNPGKEPPQNLFSLRKLVKLN